MFLGMPFYSFRSTTRFVSNFCFCFFFRFDNAIQCTCSSILSRWQKSHSNPKLWRQTATAQCSPNSKAFFILMILFYLTGSVVVYNSTIWIPNKIRLATYNVILTMFDQKTKKTIWKWFCCYPTKVMYYIFCFFFFMKKKNKKKDFHHFRLTECELVYYICIYVVDFVFGFRLFPNSYDERKVFILM